MTRSGGQGDGRRGGSPVLLDVGRNQMTALKERVGVLFFFFSLFLNILFRVFICIDLHALAGKRLCSCCTSAAVREEVAAARGWLPMFNP